MKLCASITWDDGFTLSTEVSTPAAGRGLEPLSPNREILRDDFVQSAEGLRRRREWVAHLAERLAEEFLELLARRDPTARRDPDAAEF